MSWFMVKVHPNAKKDVLVSLGAGRFEAWVKASPIEGRANEALITLLGRTLQIPPKKIRLVKGYAARRKVFQILE